MGPLLPGIFFFSSWLAMMFWGMLAPKVGLPTISYVNAMLGTIGLWLVVWPLSWGRGGWMKGGRSGSKNWRMRSSGNTSTVTADDINLSVTLGAASRRVSSQTFKGGRVSATLGGIQLDLRDVVIESKPARLQCSATMGGIEVRVPADWAVEFEVSQTLGGTTDERHHSGSTSGGPDLIIQGSVTLGAISLKN